MPVWRQVRVFFVHEEQPLVEVLDWPGVHSQAPQSCLQVMQDSLPLQTLSLRTGLAQTPPLQTLEAQSVPFTHL